MARPANTRRCALNNTSLRRGESIVATDGIASAILTAGNKTAEAVRKFLHTAYTALKQGANDTPDYFFGRHTLCRSGRSA
jgi:hypothetical protein